MSFNDIFKSNFLENITNVSILDMVIALVLAFGLGVFIFLVYKKTYSGVMYSSSFGTTLIALTMITTVVILAVTSNVVLSLGMVGALSIVRFRTAIKEPLDIAFLFWSIAVGIVLAAGMIPLAGAAYGIYGIYMKISAKIFGVVYPHQRRVIAHTVKQHQRGRIFISPFDNMRCTVRYSYITLFHLTAPFFQQLVIGISYTQACLSAPVNFHQSYSSTQKTLL